MRGNYGAKVRNRFQECAENVCFLNIDEKICEIVLIVFSQGSPHSLLPSTHPSLHNLPPIREQIRRLIRFVS